MSPAQKGLVSRHDGSERFKYRGIDIRLSFPPLLTIEAPCRKRDGYDGSNDSDDQGTEQAHY